MLPSPDVLNDFQPGKFVLSNLAAKRAKQLREGAQPLVQIESNHPLTIALAEIAAGKIRAILPTTTEPIASNIDIPMLVDDTLTGELGMLLPALDETEAALVTTALEEDSDIEPGDDDVISLSDLVADDEEEAAAVPSDDDTLSLSDIAEQETSLEEDEPED